MQPCRAVIRLDAIRGNAALLRAKAAGAKLCAVVKADAYGHGGAMVCQALTGVADCFAVALVEEGVRLRLAGISTDILVLVPPLSIEEAVRAALYGLTVSVGDGQDIALVSRALAGRGLTVRVHLQVNTGMNRFGFEEAPFAALCGEGLPPCMRAEGVYSHFYAPHDAAVTREQFSRFCAFRARAEQAFGRLTAHIAATGGVLAAEGYCLDLVRPGIGLYGYAPQGFARGGLCPAMRVYAQVAANRIYRGGGMGYRSLRPRGDALAVVRCGYADGFFRRGRLCMDAAVEESPRKKYERVCVLSDADECARACGTISYEVLVRAAARAERVYVNG